jgi:hypothetical protein
VLVKHQVKTYGPKFYTEDGTRYRITAKVRYDDQCGNGHNSFSITATIDRNECGVWRYDMGGCCHEKVTKHFPQLAPFIKWHLTSSGGPMHYVANTVYLAGERDHHGLLKGEFRQHTSRGKYQADGVEGVPNWELRFPDDFKKDVYAAEKPAPVTLEWVPSGRTGEGKARELDAARRCAVWPDATDTELMQDSGALEAQLVARLPALIAEFKTAVESLGFTY